MARRPLPALVAAPVALAFFGLAAAAPATGGYVSFVACPIARDTGPDTDLCFLAEYEGRRYALTNPADWGNPQLKHRVLVEGRLADGPAACGAARLDGRASVLAEVDASCDQVLPFDDVVRGTAGGIFNSGTPEQRARAQDLARRAEADPSLSVQPVMPDPPPPAPVRNLTVFFPFDSDRGSGPDMLSLTVLAAAAKSEGATVEVAASRGASRLSNGQVMTERAGMARQRAEKLGAILTGLGVEATRVKVRWEERPAPAQGRRRLAHPPGGAAPSPLKRFRSLRRR